MNVIRFPGLSPYRETWQAMRDYTEQRNAESEDQLWLLEHPPVYTQGLAGKPEHLLNPGNIEVIPIDRGGQITYHGPGQAVVYLLCDLKRANVGVRPMVSLLEGAVIDLLADEQILGIARADAPGVYVAGQKIASLGLKIRKGCSYHGLALNVDMDLRPFLGINPCGLVGMKMTQLRDQGSTLTLDQALFALAEKIQSRWRKLCA